MSDAPFPQTPRRPQHELHGSSYDWWPPRRDHVILYKANPLRFAHFDGYVGDWAGVEVLDVGCGGGYACEYLARRGARVHGTDLLPEALRQAREHAALTGLSITYQPCTTHRLPRGDAELDVVTCFDVLEHAEDKHTLLAEIHRVLKPGGWLLFDTMNQTFWSKLLVIWLAESVTRIIPRGTHDWQLFVAPDRLVELLRRSGFDPIELAGLRLAPRSLLARGLPARVAPRGSQAILYFGAARKRAATRARGNPQARRNPGPSQ